MAAPSHTLQELQAITLKNMLAQDYGMLQQLVKECLDHHLVRPHSCPRPTTPRIPDPAPQAVSFGSLVDRMRARASTGRCHCGQDRKETGSGIILGPATL